MIDQDGPCYHNNFRNASSVARIMEREGDTGMPRAFMLELKVQCADCGEQFRFTGCPVGLSHAQPMTDPAGEELRIPIRPASSDPDLGMGLAGFDFIPGYVWSLVETITTGAPLDFHEQPVPQPVQDRLSAAFGG